MSVGMGIPPTVTFRRPQSLTVVLVGAGGTGARVAALLPKLLRRGDAVQILDPDEVEERNLIRQHFIRRDVGRGKAEVVAMRIAGECERVGITLGYHRAAFDDDVFNRVGLLEAPRTRVARHEGDPARFDHGTIVLGCSDNKNARMAMHRFVRARSNRALIDAGNEMRGGQVLLAASSWPVWEVVDDAMQSTTYRGAGMGAFAALDALTACYPALLTPDTAPIGGAGCGMAAATIDLQTVTANNLAAAWMTTALSWFVDEIPTSVGGVTFSTLGTSATHLFKSPQRAGNVWRLGV